MITPIFEEDFHDNGYGFRSDRCAQQAIIKALDMMNNHNDWNQAIRGWVNYYRIGQMKSICRKTDQHMRFRLRMCIWKQWKRAVIGTDG